MKAVAELIGFFKRVDRVVVPSVRDYEEAGAIISLLQSKKGYNIRKSASITGDCLIAASVRSAGAVLYTQNRRDFQAIRDVFEFEVVFV
ncbi:MAG: hypothetical protein HY805_08835 [Nitrospirae bacterium]|nr:hypothetical protein [Nitrospirota bacterium]